MITELTPEQIAQIPAYREKWRKIALSIQPIEPQKVAESILRAYAIAGIQCPKIVLCDSPYAAFLYTSQEQPSWGQPTNLLGAAVGERLTRQISNQLYSQLISQLPEALSQELRRMDKPEDQQLLCNLPIMTYGLWQTLGVQLGVEWWQWEFDGPSLIDPMQLASQQGGLLDYCASVLRCSCDQARWQAFQALVQESGWILPYQKVCLICERPIYISFDGHCPVYEVGEVIIRYADGFSITGMVLGGPNPEELQFTIPTATNWAELNISEFEGVDRSPSDLCCELHPVQDALLATYRQKWKELIFKTEKIDQQQVVEAVQIAYAAIGETLPTVMFCSNPHSALTEHINHWNDVEYGQRLDNRFNWLIWSSLDNILEAQISLELRQHLTHELSQRLQHLYFESGQSQLCTWLSTEFEIIDLGWYIDPAWWACAGAYIDFCITVLNCTYDAEKWRAFKALVQYCGWMFPYTKVCYVCDRPINLIIPAHEDDLLQDFCGLLIEFADGFSLSITPERTYVSSIASSS